MLNKKIIRVFPRRTKATPDDPDVRIATLPTLFDEADKIHVSVVFSWDLQWAKFAANQWRYVAPVYMGGPAMNEQGGDFIPGMYMKQGYVITSRGCPNNCWFCSVPKREGNKLRELPITDGWIVTDDNLLACSEQHINSVFEMLKRQPDRPQFAGGLEAKLLTLRLAEKLKELKPKSLFFSYDTPDDYESLITAGKYLFDAGFKKNHHIIKSYVLIGYKGDTFEKAQKRIMQTWEAGFFPMAMLYRNDSGIYDKDWRRFQRQYANPIITASNLKNTNKINPRKILELTAKVFDVGIQDLTGKSRIQNISEARFMFCLITRKLTHLTYHSIGNYIKRDHCTVLHGIKKANELIDIYPEMKSLYKAINDEITME